ncbi:hypothetical protein [Desulfosarcina ovata]|uniref:Double-GTPase 1 domain-containing protein n=1 Tax=Desulfosarcina ovata subsp. ovata TaxID=2752305 RepID=A0A5K8A5Z3_9BACT|nr:hypothetical protein [Desulfosarcina ovata]BBO88033.1 hypothetical protein DSCOOX_12130 [Desulfosarcina ovata subsp. ovata]
MEVDQERSRLFMFGLPETGKTTFLAALWHVVESPEIDGVWKLDELFEGSRDYIEKRRQEWISYKEMKRTKVDGNAIRMKLKGRDGSFAQFEMPDLSGETFRQQFVERDLREGLAELYRKATGALLFINPNKVQDPFSIPSVETVIGESWDDEDGEDDWDEDDDEKESEVEDTAAVAIDVTDEDDSSSEEVTGPDSPEDSVKPEGETAPVDATPDSETSFVDEPSQFNISKCCTSVKVAELLQFLHSVRGTPIRLAVVVAALDELDGTPFENQPVKYIEKHFALVRQYLRANPHVFVTRVFGLSAQGTSYQRKDQLKALQNMANASDRIRLVHEDGSKTNDLTQILDWLCEAETR